MAPSDTDIAVAIPVAPDRCMDAGASKAAAAVMLEDIRRYSQAVLADAAGSHAWDHTRRVVRLCRRLGLEEGADMFVLLAAAYLHDIGRNDQDDSAGRICHAARGAELTEALLARMRVDTACKDRIVHCVRAHRFRGDEVPATTEARVLFDADKLDAIGAVGVARAYLFAGELGARLHNPDAVAADQPAYSKEDTGYREYVVKLSGIHDRMLTDAGRRMAAGRHDFMVRFFDQFLNEIEGRC